MHAGIDVDFCSIRKRRSFLQCRFQNGALSDSRVMGTQCALHKHMMEKKILENEILSHGFRCKWQSEFQMICTECLGSFSLSFSCLHPITIIESTSDSHVMYWIRWVWCRLYYTYYMALFHLLQREEWTRCMVESSIPELDMQGLHYNTWLSCMCLYSLRCLECYWLLDCNRNKIHACFSRTRMKWSRNSIL